MKTRFGSEINNGGVLPFITTSYPMSYKHSIYLKNLLEQPEEMIAAIDIMDNATESDIVQIFINCDGGSMVSLDSFMFAMSRCPAKIHCIGSGTIASAGTFVLLHCDTFELSRHTQLLFHNAQFGIGGEGQDVKEYIDFQYDCTVKFIRDMYKDLFTEEELDDMIFNKRQIYMTAPDFIERWGKTSTQGANKQFTKEVLKKLSKTQLLDLICGDAMVDEDGNFIDMKD